jgi:arylsulfatase A-like enzyme
MKRWRVAVSFVIACLGLRSARAADEPAQKSSAADRPNIILIVADDLGYADIGAQGLSKDVKTPNVDALLASGVRFTNGYVSCPVCSPTRAGLMTGRYQQRFGHEFNPGPDEAGNFGLPLDQITLPQTLKAAGYATGMVGKWHLGFKPEMLPTSRGFDSFYGFLGGAHPYNIAGRAKNVLMRNDKPVESTGYLTDVFSKEATKFVEEHAAARAKGGTPFFLYFPFNAVHTPQEAPPKYLERFSDVTEPKRKLMLAMLSALDDAVGEVLGAVEKNGQTNNTLVIFHSDNGGPTKGNGSINTPLRGFKGDTWEGGIRIPFGMKWPGHLPAGKVYDNPVISLDVFPTACAAAGAETPKGVKLDGVNLLPFLGATGMSSPSESKPHEALFWRFGAPKWAVRDGDYKLVHMGKNGTAQLFDLSKDVGEQKDLSTEKPEIAKKLQAKFDEWNGQLEKPRWKDSRKAEPGKKKAGKKKAQQAAAIDDDE